MIVDEFFYDNIKVIIICQDILWVLGSHSILLSHFSVDAFAYQYSGLLGIRITVSVFERLALMARIV